MSHRHHNACVARTWIESWRCWILLLAAVCDESSEFCMLTKSMCLFGFTIPVDLEDKNNDAVAHTFLCTEGPIPRYESEHTNLHPLIHRSRERKRILLVAAAGQLGMQSIAGQQSNQFPFNHVPTVKVDGRRRPRRRKIVRTRRNTSWFFPKTLVSFDYY